MGWLIGTTTTLRLRSVQGYSFLTSRNFTSAYTYDAASNRTGFTDPESGSTAYSYDTLNSGFGSPMDSTASPEIGPADLAGSALSLRQRLVRVQRRLSRVPLRGNALSRRTQMTRANDVTTNHTKEAIVQSQQSILTESYGYDLGSRTYQSTHPENSQSA
jgi:YD repeat-containing protein